MNNSMSWSEIISVGDPELDEQHRTLIGMFNHLMDVLHQGTTNEYIGILIDDLLSYTRLHFKNEEQYIRLNSKIDISQHINEHQKMEQKVIEYKEIYNMKSSDLSMEMIGFLRDWILRHIMQTDIQYKEDMGP